MEKKKKKKRAVWGITDKQMKRT